MVTKCLYLGSHVYLVLNPLVLKHLTSLYDYKVNLVIDNWNFVIDSRQMETVI